MAKDVEKFKEELDSLLGLNIELYRKNMSKRRDEKEIIRVLNKYYEQEKTVKQMYEEPEEPQEKPVIIIAEIKIHDTGLGYFEITYEGKNFTQCYFTKQYEKKDNMVITDDFIFVKE